MDFDKLIYDTFMLPFENRKYGNVGVELEFPLVNTIDEPIDIDKARGVFDYFLSRGFHTEIAEDEVYFITNSDGDCLSFDNSYNNFEFAMNYSDNLLKIKERFDKLISQADEYFATVGYEIVGRGTNPKKKFTKKLHVNFSTYNMVDEFLLAFGKNTPYPDFPAYLSSAQTHLDVPLCDLPRAYTLFARLDFVRALLFSNSPDFGNEGFKCYRDYLWEQSAFSLCPNITGKVDKSFETVSDLEEYIKSKGIFNRVRDGKYEVFYPMPLREYFASENAKESDIECYLSFKNVEITRRGTLEVRSDCEQTRERTFAPAAFSMGILYDMSRAEAELDRFLKENDIQKSNSCLRENAVKNWSFAPKDNTEAFLDNMVAIAYDAIKSRNKGEEILLENIKGRLT